MGEPDKTNLQTALEHTGWRVHRYDSDDWWVHESWELTSTWRPVGETTFLTLLVDPQAETRDIGSVWAVSVTLHKPNNRMDAESSAIRVSPSWPDRMKEVVAMARSLRPLG